MLANVSSNFFLLLFFNILIPCIKYESSLCDLVAKYDLSIKTIDICVLITSDINPIFDVFNEFKYSAESKIFFAIRFFSNLFACSVL